MSDVCYLVNGISSSRDKNGSITCHDIKYKHSEEMVIGLIWKLESTVYLCFCESICCSVALLMLWLLFCFFAIMYHQIEELEQFYFFQNKSIHSFLPSLNIFFLMRQRGGGGSMKALYNSCSRKELEGWDPAGLLFASRHQTNTHHWHCCDTLGTG